MFSLSKLKQQSFRDVEGKKLDRHLRQTTLSVIAPFMGFYGGFKNKNKMTFLYLRSRFNSHSLKPWLSKYSNRNYTCQAGNTLYFNKYACISLCLVYIRCLKGDQFFICIKKGYLLLKPLTYCRVSNILLKIKSHISIG